MVDDQYLNSVFGEITDLRNQHKNSIYILASNFNIPDVDLNGFTLKNPSQYLSRVSQIFGHWPGHKSRTNSRFPNQRRHFAWILSSQAFPLTRSDVIHSPLLDLEVIMIWSYLTRLYKHYAPNQSNARFTCGRRQIQTALGHPYTTTPSKYST